MLKRILGRLRRREVPAEPGWGPPTEEVLYALSRLPVKVTLYVTRDAVGALRAASRRLGISRTDAANRAFAAFNELLGMPEGKWMSLDNGDGTFRRVGVIDARVSYQPATTSDGDPC